MSPLFCQSSSVYRLSFGFAVTTSGMNDSLVLWANLLHGYGSLNQERQRPTNERHLSLRTVVVVHLHNVGYVRCPSSFQHSLFFDAHASSICPLAVVGYGINSPRTELLESLPRKVYNNGPVDRQQIDRPTTSLFGTNEFCFCKQSA